jgi:hypothetical protein
MAFQSLEGIKSFLKEEKILATCVLWGRRQEKDYILQPFLSYFISQFIKAFAILTLPNKIAIQKKETDTR